MMLRVVDTHIEPLRTKRKKKQFKTLFIKNKRRDKWDF